MLSLEWLQNTQPTKYHTWKAAPAVVFYYAGCTVPQSSSQQKTSAPLVTYSCSWCQVTCELIEQGILVLPQSHTPAVYVYLLCKSHEWGNSGAVFKVRYLVGWVFCNLALSSGMQPCSCESLRDWDWGSFI